MRVTAEERETYDEHDLVEKEHEVGSRANSRCRVVGVLQAFEKDEYNEEVDHDEHDAYDDCDGCMEDVHFLPTHDSGEHSINRLRSCRGGHA